MPAPSTKGRQKSTRPILEFLERGAQRKGKSIRETTFEEFMDSPAMGFGGAGAIKMLRGVPGIGIKLSGKQLSKSKGFRSKEPAKERANIDRPSTIAGGERRANIGGQRPPDTELEALALNKQQVGGVAKTRKAAQRFQLERDTSRTSRVPERQAQLVKIREEIMKLVGEVPPGLASKDIKEFKRLIAFLRELEK